MEALGRPAKQSCPRRVETTKRPIRATGQPIHGSRLSGWGRVVVLAVPTLSARRAWNSRIKKQPRHSIGLAIVLTSYACEMTRPDTWSESSTSQ